MQLGLMRIGSVPVDVVKKIQEDLAHVFIITIFPVMNEILPIPEKTFDPKRS
jgi:hypothetical protein